MNISSFIATAHAAAFSLKPAGTGPTKTGDLSGLITTLKDSAVTIGTVAAFALASVYLIYSGILYITSAGSPEQTKTARNGIINAIIGIVVIGVVQLIIRMSTALGTGLESGNTSGVTGSVNTLVGSRIIPIALVVAAALAVLYLIYSGIQYIVSAGNAEQAKKARNGVINAIIGIVIVMSAFFIVRMAATLGQGLESGKGVSTTGNSATGANKDKGGETNNIKGEKPQTPTTQTKASLQYSQPEPAY